jgi:predicted enzyme related to lactoylglutathione lyase
MAEDWARPLVHWELQAREPEKLRQFYGDLFNWQIGEGPIMRFSSGIGGPQPGPGGHIRQGDHPGVSLYIQVRNLRDSLTKAEQLGGKILSQPVDTPGGGPTLAGIADPEGNRVMLVQQ